MFRLMKLLWRTRKVLFVIIIYLLERDGEERPARRLVADSPADLPKSHLRTALKRTKDALKDKDLQMTAGALAYYATLSFFPAVLGLATVYTLFTSPSNLLNVAHSLDVVFPAAISSLLYRQLQPIASSGGAHVGIAALISILLLLWTTSGGVQNLIKGLDQAYETEESRNPIKLRLTSIGLSILLLITSALAIFLLILQSSALTHWGVPHALAVWFPILRWLFLVILLSFVLAALYRYAPNRKQPRWSWVSWGATTAIILWLIASALFFIYAQNFANFNRTYGTFAGIIILMTWFNVSGLIILLGAQVNKKLEEVSVTPAR